MKILYSESGYSSPRETAYSTAPGMGKGDDTGNGWGDSDTSALVTKGEHESRMMWAIFLVFLTYQIIAIFEVIVYGTLWFLGAELAILSAAWVVSFIPGLS